MSCEPESRSASVVTNLLLSAVGIVDCASRQRRSSWNRNWSTTLSALAVTVRVVAEVMLEPLPMWALASLVSSA